MVNYWHPYRTRIFTTLFFIAASSTFCGVTARADFVDRQQEVLSKRAAENTPAASCSDEDLRGECQVLGALAFALSALYQGADERQITSANEVLQSSISSLSRVLSSDQARQRVKHEGTLYNRFRLPLSMLARTYFLFGPSGAKAAGLLNVNNQAKIRDLLGDFVEEDCRISDANSQDTWTLRASENIHALAIGVCWAAAEILSDKNVLQYRDGSRPSEQREAWTTYLKAYIRQRAKFGGLVEFFSQYYKYTLVTFFNSADFSSDSRLRELASSFLDVWLADWAEEQVNGIHGGSKARVYFSSLDIDPIGSQLGWLYFGIGTASPSLRHPTFIAMVTSSYRPPSVVGKIATQVQARGSYEVRSRRPGLLDPSSPANLMHIDGPAGGILRYTYVTPSFVMGTSLFARRPSRAWAPPSAQNRWNGMVLADSPRHYIFASPAYPEGKGYRSIYSSEWGIQYKGTQVIQKLDGAFSRGAGPMAVWFGEGLKPEKDGDWIFFDAHAFVAVRSVFGRLDERGGAPRSFLATDQSSPIILHASARADFANFAAFKSAVKAAPLSSDGGALRFRPPGSPEAIIDFNYNSGALPQLNGKAINLVPDYVFDSPFMHARWGEGIVTIRFGHEQVTRDFRQ